MTSSAANVPDVGVIAEAVSQQPLQVLANLRRACHQVMVADVAEHGLGRGCRQGFDREIMTTDNLGAFYSGNITSANGTQLVLTIAPDTCGAGCVLISVQCGK